MKKLLYILITIFTFHPLYSQWVQQTSGVSSPLYNVDFVNLNTGWVTGSNSIILKTTNGGINWFQQTIDLGYPKNLYGLDMLDANTGYIAGWFETILKTTNGGTNWQIISNIPSNNGNSNNAVSFIDAQTGWVCSFSGRVLHTINGGISWDTANVGNTGPLRDIQFLNSQTGWVCGDVGNLVKSTNGGINWVSAPLLTTANLLSLYFLNVNTGWTVSEQANEVFRTTNGGAKWDTVAVLPGGNLLYSYTIYFSSPLTGYVGGTNSRLFKTTDGGLSWARDQATFLAFFWNFSFFNDSIGWCIGGQGTIIHTTTGGGPFVGIQSVSNNESDNYELYQNYPNPFNPVTRIKFRIPETGLVELIVYDLLGREISILVNGKLEAGTYETNFNGSDLTSGIYFYKLFTNKNTLTKKMILLK